MDEKPKEHFLKDARFGIVWVFVSLLIVAVVVVLFIVFHTIHAGSIFPGLPFSSQKKMTPTPTPTLSPYAALAQKCPFVRDNIQMINSIVPEKNGIVGSITGDITYVRYDIRTQSARITVSIFPNQQHYDFVIANSTTIYGAVSHHSFPSSKLKSHQSFVLSYECMTKNNNQFVIKQILLKTM